MKKIIALFLAALMCLSLCACAEEADTSRKKKDKDEAGNSYEEYEELLEYLEEENFEAALRYVQELYDEQQANLPDVPADAEDQYQNLMWCLEAYVEGSNVWLDGWDESIGGSDLAKYMYEQLEQMGDYKDCKDLLARFAVVQDVHLRTRRTDLDNLGNTNEYSSSQRFYNAQGQLVELESPMNQETERHIFGYDFWGNRYYTYDASGNVVSMECGYVYDDSKDINALVSFSYDENGRLIKLESNTADGTTYTTEYTYDDQGRLIKVTTQGGYNNYITEYFYDEAGRLVKEVCETYYSGSSLDDRTTIEYTFDDNGVATGYTELIQDNYSSYYKTFYNTQTNVHVWELDGQVRVVTDNVTYGMVIDREGNESKPDAVSSVYTYTYGDYYIYE